MIVLLGVLAAVVLFALGDVSGNAAIAACKADASTVDSAISGYNTQTGGTPVVTAALLTTGANPYLKSFPSSPNDAISIVSGVEWVATPSTDTAVQYGSTSECNGA